MGDQIAELFLSEDKDLFDVPYTKNSSGEVLGARGSLYNWYKNLREQIRVAGLLSVNISENSDSSLENENEVDGKEK